MTREQNAVITAAMEFYRWLVKRDFKGGDFTGAKGRYFDACSALSHKRRARRG